MFHDVTQNLFWKIKPMDTYNTIYISCDSEWLTHLLQLQPYIHIYSMHMIGNIWYWQFTTCWEMLMLGSSNSVRLLYWQILHEYLLYTCTMYMSVTKVTKYFKFNNISKVWNIFMFFIYFWNCLVLCSGILSHVTSHDHDDILVTTLKVLPSSFRKQLFVWPWQIYVSFLLLLFIYVSDVFSTNLNSHCYSIIRNTRKLHVVPDYFMQFFIPFTTY